MADIKPPVSPVELAYERHFWTREKPILVLANGLFATQQSWEPVVSSLGVDFKVLTFDFRGQGQSPQPQTGYTLEGHTTDLFHLLEKLKISSAFFLGLSHGARVSLNFAAHFPEKAAGVIACDSYAQASPLLKRKLLTWLAAHRMGGAQHRFDIALPWVWGESFYSENNQEIDTYRERAAQFKDRVMAELIQGACEGDIALHKIKCPVLLATGEEDLLTPALQMKKMLPLLPHGSWIPLKGGHASLIEYPENIEEKILPRLRKWNQQEPQGAQYEMAARDRAMGQQNT